MHCVSILEKAIFFHQRLMKELKCTEEAEERNPKSRKNSRSKDIIGSTEQEKIVNILKGS